MTYVFFYYERDGFGTPHQQMCVSNTLEKAKENHTKYLASQIEQEWEVDSRIYKMEEIQ